MAGSVILGGARTPVGKMNGALASKSAVELGGIALAESIRRSGVPRESIEHVIMGQVLQGGAGQIPSRQAAINAGLAETVTSETINRVCGSGLPDRGRVAAVPRRREGQPGHARHGVVLPERSIRVNQR